MKYMAHNQKRRWPKRLVIVGVILTLLMAGGAFAARHVYFRGLEPVAAGSQSFRSVVIERGASLEEITKQLKEAGLIRNEWAFKLYVARKNAASALQAGTYTFSPGQSVADLVTQLTHGKVATDLVTIIPAQSIKQIKASLVNYGFAETDVESALNPAFYAGHPALAGKPLRASLEGYIYPDSYQRHADTTPQQIITAALDEMDEKLTPELEKAFAKYGLSPHEGVILASVVEREVSKPEDRRQVAQVFLKRLSIGMRLGSDVTAFYGASLAGAEPSVLYDSPYNTRLHEGLPPTPISNVTIGSLRAVANPASTDWLYFVAGDDGTTHFARTLSQHEANVVRYCTKLCGR